MQLLSDLMTDSEDQTRKPVHSTVSPDLEAKLKKLVKEARGVGGLHIAGMSSAIARVLETADLNGWLDDADSLLNAYLVAVAKSTKRK